MKILNRNNLRIWPPGAIYIGRGTPLGNPSSIQEAGSRDQALADFYVYLEALIGRVERGTGDAHDQATYETLRSLREDSELVCSCAPKPCHGDIIKQFWASHFKPLRPLVFVFGSNLAGRHGKGAAEYARNVFGARMGVGEGPTGSAYALPTRGERIQTRKLLDIAVSAQRFIDYAKARPDIDFRLTPVGCGLAGYAHKHIAPLFFDAPANVLMPAEWKDLISARQPIRKTHRLLIAGSRSVADAGLVQAALSRAVDAYGRADLAVISGLAKGADLLGKAAAESLGVSVLEYPADWQDFDDPFAMRRTKNGYTYNANAGFNRNIHMGMASTLPALLFWDGKSPGTRQMAETLKLLGKPFYVIDFTQRQVQLPDFPVLDNPAPGCQVDAPKRPASSVDVL